MASQGSVFSGGQHKITGGTFLSAKHIHLNDHITKNNVPESAAFTKLTTNAAPSALHNSGEISDPQKCHPGTRVDILTVLVTWALLTVYEFPIQWLNGPAGAGKSAIMRSLAEILVEKSLLLASFFFFRSDGRRNTAERLISTISYQLCVNVPPLQPWVERAIELNPLIFNTSLADQIQTLIINPFLHYFYDPNSVIISPFPRIIIIDGMDECTGDENQQEILHTFCKMVQTLPIPIAIVFASRPEHQIRITFELGRLSEVSSRITLDESFNPDKDIRHFYLAEFAEIQSTHPMRSYLGAIWPSEEVIQLLILNASGQFIYASTIIKFVKSNRHNPALRIQMVLGYINRGKSKPFQQLDNLYTAIFLNVHPDVIEDALQLLGIILTPGPDWRHQSPKFIESLLGLPAGHVRSTLLDLESLLTVAGDDNDIHIYHTSLSDFLFDHSRAREFFTDRCLVYADIASSCINQICRPQMPTANALSQYLLRSYFEAQILISLQNATPTDGLHRAIVSCDVDKLISFPQSEGVSPIALVLLFLVGLMRSFYPDAESLCETKLTSFERVINPQLMKHWLGPGQHFRHSLLFVLSLALTPDHPMDINNMIKHLLTKIEPGRQPLQGISVLPGILYTERGHATFQTVEDWQSLAILIANRVDSITGLLYNPRGQEACTDLRVHLVQELYDGDLIYHYLNQLQKILPILLRVSFVRGDLVTAVEKAQLVGLWSENDQQAVMAIEDAFTTYTQRASYNVWDHMAPVEVGEEGCGCLVV